MNARTPEGIASSQVGSFLPVSLIRSPLAIPPRESGPLVVPPDDQLRLARADAKSAGKLKDLRQMVAAWEAVAEKCDLAFEEMVRLAVFRLEVERDLGAELAQTVRHGGDRSRSPRVTLRDVGGLPAGITKQQAAKYRALAAIPAEMFQAYVEKARARHDVPSSTGARKFASSPSPTPRKTRSKASHAHCSVELPPLVLDAVCRVITPDVCVGDADIGAKRRVTARAKNVLDELAGDVVVADCPEPALWLRALQRRRKQARLQDAIVVLAAAVWEDWFRSLITDGWTVCFVQGARSGAGVGIIVAHVGTRQRAFRLVFGAIGVLVPS